MTATTRRRLGIAGIGVSFTLALSGCAGFGNLGTDPGVTTVTLATVNNPQMQDMAQLLPEFNKLHPNIKINMIFMEENDLRNAATKDVATKGGQYDIMTVGAYEVPIWGANRWLVDLTDLAAKDPAYDVNDFFQPVRDGVSVDNRLYAVPFYGESSFLMYRKDLFQQAGLTMPERPTWEQVAQFAQKLKDPATDRAGICLRGKPGWGEMFAPLTTMVNTFGGQWYDMNWNAQVNQPGFTSTRCSSTSTPWRPAVKPTRCPSASPSASTSSARSVPRCGTTPPRRPARWRTPRTRRSPERSATSGPRSRRPVTPAGCGRGTSGSTPSPTQGPGLGVPQVGDFQGVRQAGRLDHLGWSKTPPGTRKSTYQIPEYIQAGGGVRPADGQDHV